MRHTKDPKWLKDSSWFALRVLIVIIVACQVTMVASNLASCTSHGRQDTIHATYLTTNAARDAFVAWDKQHQAEIVAGATSHDDGIAKLSAYHEKRAEVADLFVKMYQSIVAAQEANDDLTVTTMVNLMLTVKTTVETFTKGVP